MVRYRNPLDRSERLVRVDGPAPDRMTFSDDPRLFDLVRTQMRSDETAEFETVPFDGAELSEAAMVELGWRLSLDDVGLVGSVVALLQERELVAGGVCAIAVEVEAAA